MKFFEKSRFRRISLLLLLVLFVILKGWSQWIRDHQTTATVDQEIEFRGPEFQRRVNSFKVNEKEALGLALSARKKLAKMGTIVPVHGKAMYVVGRYYFFGDWPRDHGQEPLTGFFVNGDSGEVEYRECYDQTTDDPYPTFDPNKIEIVIPASGQAKAQVPAP